MKQISVRKNTYRSNGCLGNKSEFNLDTYKQLFGNRINEANIIEGAGRDLIMDMCKIIKEQGF